MSIERKSLEEKNSLLERCDATTLSSKLVGGEKDGFVKMVVDLVTTLGEDSHLHMIGIKKGNPCRVNIKVCSKYAQIFTVARCISHEDSNVEKDCVGCMFLV
jgi:putative lipoic acid-binding regulatory protein